MAEDTKIAALFDLPGARPSLCDENVCSFFTDCLSKFYKHVIENESRHPWINKIELNALDAALEKMQAKTPHEKVDWMPEYGCAVLKSGTGIPGEIALNLISLQLYRFQTTSKLSESFSSYSYFDHAVSSDYEVLPIGKCKQDELEDLQDRFRGLLASAEGPNGRVKKNGYQRTPPLIHALYREAFGSPNQSPRGGFGGFLEVGIHTAWQLVSSTLQQMFTDHEGRGHPPLPDLLIKKTILYFGLYISEVTVSQYKAKFDEYKKNQDDSGRGISRNDVLSSDDEYDDVFSSDDEYDGQDEVSSDEESNGGDKKLLSFELGLLLDAFRILRSTSICAANLSDDGLDMGHYLNLSKKIRCTIMEEVSSQSALFSRQFKLPRTGGHFRNYRFDLPSSYSPAEECAMNQSEIHKNICRNLGWLPVLQGRNLECVDNLVKALMPSTNQDILPSMFVLKSVERVMWDYAQKLPKLKQNELQTLVSVVDNYREVLHRFKGSRKYSPLSLVELKSREVLVVWLAFCIIHSNARRLHKTEMEGYGVPLDFNDLSHLVLSNRTEWDAGLRIAEYLNKHGTEKPVFSLNDETSTFDLGRRIAQASSDMVKVWDQEEKDASCRVEGHWKEVLRKQECARKLRQEIANLEVEKAEANRKLVPKRNELAEHERKLQARNSPYASADTIYAYDGYAHRACERSVNELSSEVRSLESQLSSNNSALRSALAAPPPVFQPLPQEKHNALPVIFFLYMPPVFQLLSRFSFTAQQLLLPQPWENAWGGNEGSDQFDITPQVTRGSEYCQYSWKDYYNNQQNSQYYQPNCSRNGSDYYVLLRSTRNNVVPKEWGSKSVDHIHSKSDGIWYPDQLKPRMAWFGGPKSFDRAVSGYEINPFVKLDHFIVVSNFTERLTAQHSNLQWALMQPGDQHILPTRGNLPYARQNIKPDCLSKPQYLSFGNMRAFPNIQLRNILNAIQDRLLPFTEEIVHTLVYQSLFHMGKISSEDGQLKLEWKTDLANPYFGRDANEIFELFYEEIKDSPKNYKCVKFIGSLCNVFSEWEVKCRNTARNLAKAAFKWAEDLGSEIEKSPPSSAPSIRAKQVVLYQHAIMVLSGGSLDGKDVAALIKMIVKSKNLFTEDKRSREIGANATEIKYALSQKLGEIIEAASLDPSILTQALRSVFQRCPKSLHWKRWSSDNNTWTQCFEARGKDGCFYNINVVTGEILINGLPPSQLPLSILGHQMYIRSFGDRNFEVVEKGNFLETCHPVFGRFYKFSKGSPIKIYEFKEDESEMLELLDGTADGILWSRDLPIRLKSMHSHWLDRGKHLIALRDICFKDRNISFLIKLRSNCGENVEGEVKCINMYCDDRQNLSRLAQNMHGLDTLVFQEQSKALNIISKFEPKKYIHSLVNAQNELSFFCPRYNLTFTLLQGVLCCREIAGYQLMRYQQSDKVFRGITKYLILTESKGNGMLIIFPKGEVVRKSPGCIDIEVKDDFNEQVMWYQYKFHPRFKYLENKQSRASRMQLAALHIATSSVIPDEVLGMTGEERAAALVRQCWGNRPLTKEECLVLNNIKQLAHGLSPTISMLCQDIEKSSGQLNFLYSPIDDNSHTMVQSFEGSAYLHKVKNNQESRRNYLTPREESRLIGVLARKPTLPPRFAPTQKLEQCPVTLHEVKSMQKHLDQYRSKIICNSNSKGPNTTADSFPLVIKPSSNLERDMMNELKESWNAHLSSTRHHSPKINLNGKSLQKIQIRIARLKQKVEDFVLDALNQVSNQHAHWHDNAHEILRVAGLIPTATAADLAKIAIDPALIGSFNPMLSVESQGKLVESIIIWLRLCVYEDKLHRLIFFVKTNSTEDVMKELDTVTLWSASDHPYWLVFEVENGIQIRQEQYKVAKHLIDNPGNIIQLNMGLGKTRVILPMLVLYSSFHDQRKHGGQFVREKVARLHFLSALFEEAYKYLQDSLCASILGVKIYQMPFCRDFKLDDASIDKMKSAINDCRLDGGALVVAPEHRLSLALKAKELHCSGETDIASRIEKELIKEDFWDILDECDELLRHRYQLIYAIGAAVPLPGGFHRWQAAQALFAALSQNDALKNCLSSHTKACKMSKKPTGEWPEIQFFDGEPLNSMLGEQSECRSARLSDGLLLRLSDAILTSPPHELEWLLEHPLKDAIKKAMFEKDFSLTSLESLAEHHLSYILSFRGFLAGGILRHCLLKRHRVDFGVARPGKKRLAVPFRFADTPDERSEFAHPDCAIVFTILAYYNDGLSHAELMQALKNLNTLGDNARRNFYNSWFATSSDEMKAKDPECFESLDCIEKIDITNEVQMEKMYIFYHRNMNVINFYLNTSVFPTETDQFESRLTATSWNLAQNKSNSIVGFSGTNDNHRILPLQVRQYFPSLDQEKDEVLKELDGTNGKMLQKIIKNTVEVLQLETKDNNFSALTNILSKSIKGSMRLIHAIIDCGALLAGTDLCKISSGLLNMLPVNEFGGVLFYDDEIYHDWVVMERSGRLLPKDISPIAEREAFAIFDEPRCRGTDLKLRSEAIALMTLAPKLCKDKLMQAAGRLRKLGHNQKLIIAGGSDVFSKLNEGKNNGLNVAAINVLSWAMKNTVESTASGLSNWASQGLFFASTFGKDPKLNITEEILGLKDMYGKPFTEQTVAKMAASAHLYHMKRTGGEDTLCKSEKRIIDSIFKQVEEYGQDFMFSASGCDEECERELELEIEEEEEVEVEVPVMDPVGEQKWDFGMAFRCQSPPQLPTGVTSLPTFIKNFVKPTSLARIKWSENIYCTDNFAHTIVCRIDKSMPALNLFLRVVNFVLCFPNGSFLLLSEFEANALLGLFWKSGGGSHHIVHSSFLRQSLDSESEILLQCTLQQQRSVVVNNLLGERLQGSDVIRDKCMASMQLFSGESTYATEERKQALKLLLRVCKTNQGETFCPRTEAERIVEMRGLKKLYPYSDLEALCEKLLCEL